MKPTRAPTLRFLNHSQLGQDSWHSLLMSLLRGLAAVQVAAAHLRAEFFPALRTLDNPTLWYQGLAFLTGFAHQAVIVFFVISGWLVGGSLLNKLGQPEAFKLYAIDRVTRLWTVLLPTFALIIALAIVSGAVDPRTADFSPANEFSTLTGLGNLIGLQTVVLPRFGGNYPLWSLANETWYYLMFPLLVLCIKADTTRRRLFAALTLVALGAWLPAAMVMYFSIWLMGAGMSRVRIDCGASARVLLCAALAVSSVWFRLNGSNDDLVEESLAQDGLLGLLLLLILSSSVLPLPRHSRPVEILGKAARFVSDFSFTLYVVHVPVLGLLGFLGTTLFATRRLGADSPADLLGYIAMLGFLLASAYGFYRLFEARTDAVRRAMKKLIAGPLPIAARTAPAKH